MFDIGTDIVENKRIEKSINHDFISKVLTNNEILICNNKVGKKKIEFICGRFCAKEAIIKCLSDYEKVNMLDIEILNNENGKPIAKFKDYKILLSISHEKEYTIAFAITKK